MWPFNARPRINVRSRKVNTGKAAVKVVLLDKREFDLEFFGEYLGIHPLSRDDDWIYDASDVFRSWQKRSAATGMVNLGQGHYVPLCNVSDVNVEFIKHEIEVKE